MRFGFEPKEAYETVPVAVGLVFSSILIAITILCNEEFSQYQCATANEHAGSLLVSVLISLRNEIHTISLALGELG